MDHPHDEAPPFWRSAAGWGLALAVAVGGFYLVTESTAHLLGALPSVFLLACPLLHLFTHRGHGHKRHGHLSSDDEQRRQ